MSSSSFSGLTIEQLDLIDRTAGRFETKLKSGGIVDIEEVVASVPLELQEILREELAGIEDELRSSEQSGRTEKKGELTPEGITQIVDGYEIIETLGRGGMGVVYRALDLELQREVALKMILSGEHVSERHRQRFLAEAAAVARLQHANIVQVFSMGSEGETPYFAMELVEGGTLADATDEEPSDPRFAAELIAQLAAAVDYAHQNGVVHRDLKPSNVLLSSKPAAQQRDSSSSFSKLFPSNATSESDSSTSEARHSQTSALSVIPKLTDFGLARILDTDSQLTGTGEVLGTPQYMSPEQARGDAEVGPLSDIYSLGAILYRLLTGITPFRGETAIETLHDVIEAEPVSPKVIRPSLPIDLATICLKCLEKVPQRRYATAMELADDLNRWLRHEPIQAKRATSVEKLLKWIRRRPVHATAILFALVLSIGGPLMAIKQAGLKSEIAEANDGLEKSNETLTQQLYLADMRQASAAVVDPRGGPRLRSLLERWQDSELRGWEWEHFQHRLNSTNSEILQQYESSVGARAVQTTQAGDEFEAIGVGREVSLYRTTFNQKRTLLWTNNPERGAISHLAFSSNQKHLAAYTVGYQGVYIWEVESGDRVRAFNAEYNSNGVVWSPKEPDLVAVNLVYEVGLFRISQKEPIRKFRGPHNTRLAMVWAKDGSGFYAAAHQGGIYFVPSEPIEDVVTLLPYETRMRSRSIDLSPDGKQLLIGDDLGVIRIFDIESREFRFTQPSHKGLVSGVAWSPDQKKFASVGADGALLISVIRTGFQKYRRGHDGPIHGISWTEREGLKTWGDDGTIRLWADDPLDQLDKLNGLVLTAIDWSPNGNRLIATGTELVSIDFSSNAPKIERFNLKSSISTDVNWLPNGHDVALIFRDHVVTTPPKEILDIKAELFTRKLQQYEGYEKARDLEISPTRPWVASAGSSGLMVYNFKTGEEIGQLKELGVHSIAFTPTGNKLLYPFNNKMHEWNIETGEIVAKSKAGSPIAASPISFHPDGNSFAYGGDTIHFVDYPSGELKRSLEGHTGNVNCLQFSPDGQRLASGGADNTVRIWDVHSGEEAAILQGHHAQMTALSWTPDGKTLASTDESGAIRIWKTSDWSTKN